MDTWILVVIAVVAAAIVVAVIWSALRTRRSQELRERFGPEYDRVAADAPTKREAESELRAREERREQLEIRPLSAEQRERYQTRWTAVQAEFVDDPAGAVTEADSLIQDVMRERGYPVDDFDTRAADLSVDHPDVVENYRAGHGIATAHERGKAGTEELRKAVQHYRALFEELLEIEPSQQVDSVTREPSRRV
jgi:FtsZ-interacting cell division protein ZipA